jgi:hypothetical protein
MAIAIVDVGQTDHTTRDLRAVGAMVLDAIHRVLADAGEAQRRSRTRTSGWSPVSARGARARRRR